MNKVKLMFTAAAVFVVVGSALAVKPTFSDRVCRTNPSNGSCAPGGVTLTCDSGSPQTNKQVTASGTGSDCYRVVAAGVTNCNTQTCPTKGTISDQP